MVNNRSHPKGQVSGVALDADLPPRVTAQTSIESLIALANDAGRANAVTLALRVDDACRALGIGRTSLYELIAQGKLKSALVAGRRVVPIPELQRVLAESLDI